MFNSKNLNYIKLAIFLLEDHSKKVSEFTNFKINSNELMQSLVDNFIIHNNEMEMKVNFNFY